MTRIAVTGATGRLGRLLRRHWGAEGALWIGRRADGPVRAVDLAMQPDALRGCDTVIHLAGPAAGADQPLGIHVDLAQSCARACRVSKVAHLVLMSSAAVYGRSPEPCHEDSAAPISDYGQEKLRMEYASKAWAGPELAVSVIRLGNVAGCDALLGQDLSLPPGIDRFADGSTPKRSYIGPATLARAMNRIAATPPAPWRVMNLAQPGAVAMGDLLDAASIPWNPRPAPDSAIASVTLDTTRAQDLLGADLPLADASTIIREWQEDRS